MSDRIIGVLGGMGPAATADFYWEIIKLTPARRDQDHIPVLIYSNPRMPDRTRAILEGAEDPLPWLLEAAVTLERGGAGMIAIPCNTAHYYLPQIQASVRIPVLNMVEETCLTVRSQFPRARAVGLLAATGTVQCKIYHQVCERQGMQLITPSEEDQARVHNAIFQVKGGDRDGTAGGVFESIGEGLIRMGAEAVILGCTEIPVAFNPRRVEYFSLSSTRVLAQAAVDWALGKRG
jgi:aspartate racemase